MENKLPIHIGESNEMVTAVEWLKKEFHARGPIGEDMPIWLKKLYDQALAMEKEQIIDAYNNGDLRSAELYYNETYGK